MGEVQEAHSMGEVQKPMLSCDCVQGSVLLTATRNGSKQLQQT